MTLRATKTTEKKKEEPQRGLEYGPYRVDHQNSSNFKICARFQMKPEGVTVNQDGQLFVVFDEDLDRKAGEEEGGVPGVMSRFPLLNHQDYVYTQTVSKVLEDCR